VDPPRRVHLPAATDLLLSACLLGCAGTVVVVLLASPAWPQQAFSDAGSHPCIVLAGGGGTVSGSDATDEQWFTINDIVSRNAMEALADMGYDVIDYIVDVRDAEQRAARVHLELERSGCTKILQIGHQLRPASGIEPPGTFAFVVSVLHAEDSPGRRRRQTAVFAQVYQRAYEYPMTREVLETLSLTKLGRTIAGDVAASGALP
jgi:hypothetical protein